MKASEKDFTKCHEMAKKLAEGDGFNRELFDELVDYAYKTGIGVDEVDDTRHEGNEGRKKDAMEAKAYVKIHYSDGTVNETQYDDRLTAFHEAAKAVAFRDLEDDMGEVELFVDNELFEYDGWRPGMEIAFVSPETKEEMRGWFPEWDH